MQNKKLQSTGRSMIEMLGVLAIIGVLSAGGIMGYTAAMENYRINKLIEDIQTMAAATAPYFSNLNKASDLSMDDLHTLGILPDSYYKTKIGSWNWRNVWGSRVTAPTKNQAIFYAYKTYNSRKENRFTSYIYTPSQKLCVKLSSHKWGEYGNKVMIEAHLGPIKILPLSINEAETFCKNITKEKANILIHFFYSNYYRPL